MTAPADRPLRGRVALVTGASRGIGQAIAAALGAAGARVACTARSEAQAAATAAAIRDAGGEAAAFRLDVTRPDEIAATVAALGPVDVLVNNAGVLLQKPALALGDEEWEHVLATNLTSMFRCARAVAPSMIARGGGRIINLGSIWGRVGVPQYAAYCVSKAGVDGLTRALAAEWARHGIRVNCLAPGHVRTDFSTGAMADERTRSRILSRIPLRRLAEPREVGELAVYLASPASEFITGQTIYLDGGETIAW